MTVTYGQFYHWLRDHGWGAIHKDLGNDKAIEFEIRLDPWKFRRIERTASLTMPFCTGEMPPEHLNDLLPEIIRAHEDMWGQARVAAEILEEMRDMPLEYDFFKDSPK